MAYNKFADTQLLILHYRKTDFLLVSNRILSMMLGIMEVRSLTDVPLQ